MPLALRSQRWRERVLDQQSAEQKVPSNRQCHVTAIAPIKGADVTYYRNCRAKQRFINQPGHSDQRDIVERALRRCQIKDTIGLLTGRMTIPVV